MNDLFTPRFNPPSRPLFNCSSRLVLYHILGIGESLQAHKTRGRMNNTPVIRRPEDPRCSGAVVNYRGAEAKARSGPQGVVSQVSHKPFSRQRLAISPETKCK